MKFDYLIAGAGYAGSVIAERLASQLNKKVLVVDKKDHIGGHAYDYYDEHGILIHKFGPHIFHTNSKKVWDYLSSFTEWIFYEHKVLAVIEGKKVPIPFNFNSINKLFPEKYAEKLEKKLLEKYSPGLKIPILKLKKTADKELKFLAQYIYENLFYGYTVKQWGLTPEELDYSVTSRVPVLVGRDDRYFQDKYQGVPAAGYTEMFRKMLSHPNIRIMLKTDYKEIINYVKFDSLVFTGNIDYFFDYAHGALPYRSLRFDRKTFDMEFFQDAAQVNYPNNYDFTRITEFKRLTKQRSSKTSIAIEYPEECEPGKNDPYYPIPKDENNDLYQKYKNEAEKLSNAHFVGRLAEYKYYNMDQITGVALQYFEKYLALK